MFCEPEAHVSGAPVSPSVLPLQEELATLRRQLEGSDGELKRLEEESFLRAGTPGGADGTERGRLGLSC